MILTCPECATRFMVPDDALLPEGRNVKCGKCHYRWFADPPPRSAFLDEAYDAVQVTPLEPEEQAPFPAHNLPAVAGRPPARTTALAWGVLIVMLALLGSIVWFGRVQLVTAMPVFQPVYEQFGVCVGVSNPVTAFRFSGDPSPSRAESGELVISGELVRDNQCARYVPDIIVEFLDTDRQVLQRTSYPIGIAQLEPGKPTPFALRIERWPDNIADINLLFTIPNVQGG